MVVFVYHTFFLIAWNYNISRLRLATKEKSFNLWPYSLEITKQLDLITGVGVRPCSNFSELVLGRGRMLFFHVGFLDGLSLCLEHMVAWSE